MSEVDIKKRFDKISEDDFCGKDQVVGVSMAYDIHPWCQVKRLYDDCYLKCLRLENESKIFGEKPQEDKLIALKTK